MNSEDTVRRLQKYQRNIEKIKRSKKMTIEDVIKKALIPMISMVFWLWIVYCKIKVPKVAKQKWTLLHVQNGQNCKVLYQRVLRNGVAPER